MKKSTILVMLLSVFLWRTPSSLAGGISCESNSSPTLEFIPDYCGTTQNVHVGTPFVFSGNVIDTDLDDMVILSVIGLPVSAVTSPTLPYSGSDFPFSFLWTPTPQDAGITHIITLTAVDLCGAVTTCNLFIYVTCAPTTISCPGTITTTASGPNCSAVVTYVVSASNPSGISNLVSVPPSGSTFPAGKTTVTATATDLCGNDTTCSFDVIVNSPAAVQLTCLDSINVETGTCPVVLGYQVSATGAEPVTIIYDPPPFSSFPIGTTMVTATATDACGSTADCSFPVIVKGPLPPILHCPSDTVVVSNQSGCSAIVNYPLRVDNYSTSSIMTISHYSGATFPLGTTTVTITITDGCGQRDSCSFTVTVVSSVSVEAGPDASTVFGYASTEMVTNTALASGGNGSYTYNWTLSRALKCNQVNTSGDELFTGGSCNNNNCPGTGTATAAAPSCTGSASISATLLADATACVTVTDGSGCSASDCFNIAAVDGRCFTGNSGKKKVKVCHHTNSPVKPWITICLDKPALNAHLARNPDDKVGPCPTVGGRLLPEDEMDGFHLYPNPVNAELTLEFEFEAERTIQVFNALGALILEKSLIEKQIQLDMSALPKGMYLISVKGADHTMEVKRFVKQ